MKTSFNLSDWALRHRSLVWYFMGIFAVMGVASYLNLGREEDPSFTIKTMLIQAQWPGASVDEMSKQVTERIERKLEELDVLDYTKSMTTPGQTIVFVYLRDATKGRDVPNTWMRVRNMMNDIRSFAVMPMGAIFRPLKARTRCCLLKWLSGALTRAYRIRFWV